MRIIMGFWSDEYGGVLSAELVTIGAVVAVGAVAGLREASNAINDELGDVASAVRSLDQSYSFHGFRGCNSMTAGSAFVDTSIGVVADQQAGPDNLLPSDPSTPESRERGFVEELNAPASSADEPITPADAKLDQLK